MIKIEYFDRNKTLLADKKGYRKPAKENEVNLNWWHIDYGEDIQNLGDMLASTVYDYMCEYYHINNDKRIRHTKHLYAIGSILFYENQDAVVWGTGSTQEMRKSIDNILHQRILRTLDVRCVRGPKTRNNLLRLGIPCPEIYGDPAMLMPLIYQPNISERNKTLIINHFQDDITDNSTANNIVSTDMLTSNWKEKIDLIASAKTVISSSLHGVILAESYGVPAIVLNTDNRDLFKYYDYYEGTGRNKMPLVHSIDEGLEYNLDHYVFPDITVIQNNLIKTFPKNLWD